MLLIWQKSLHLFLLSVFSLSARSSSDNRRRFLVSPSAAGCEATFRYVKNSSRLSRVVSTCLDIRHGRAYPVNHLLYILIRRGRKYNFLSALIHVNVSHATTAHPEGRRRRKAASGWQWNLLRRDGPNAPRIVLRRPRRARKLLAEVRPEQRDYLAKPLSIKERLPQIPVYRLSYQRFLT